MAFPRESNVTKVGIGGFLIRFDVPSPGSGDPTTSRLDVQIELSNGLYETKTYDLLERLDDDAAGIAHKANLIELRDYIISRLENEALPL